MDEENLVLIQDCENREERLDDWERGFLDSIRRQLENNRRLTDAQETRLNAIWEKVTEKS